MKLTANRIVVERYGGHLFIALAGEFDSGNVHELAAALEAATLPETSTVQMELSGVVYLDSSALSALVEFHRLASSEGIEVRICSASRVVRRLLEILQLETMFGLT